MKRVKFLATLLTGAVTASLLVPTTFANTTTPETKPLTNIATTTTTGSAIELSLTKLKEGNDRYFTGKSLAVDTSVQKRAELQKGQHPFALVVSCSDSRVVDPLIFNQGLGDLFEVKLAGNILNTEALGTIEYGVEHLNIPVIVIMGHEKCGAVHATVEACTTGKFPKTEVGSLIRGIKPAYYQAKKVVTAKDNLDELTCDKNIDLVKQQVLRNTVVKELVEQGKLKVVTAKYYLDGHVEWK